MTLYHSFITDKQELQKANVGEYESRFGLRSSVANDVSNFYLYVRLSDIIKKHDFEISAKLDHSDDRVTLTISGENDLPTTYLPFNPKRFGSQFFLKLKKIEILRENILNHYLSIGSSANLVIDINRQNYQFFAILNAPWILKERFEKISFTHSILTIKKYSVTL